MLFQSGIADDPNDGSPWVHWRSLCNRSRLRLSRNLEAAHRANSRIGKRTTRVQPFSACLCRAGSDRRKKAPFHPKNFTTPISTAACQGGLSVQPTTKLASFVENRCRLVYIYCMENPLAHFNKAEKNIYQEKPGWNRLDD